MAILPPCSSISIEDSLVSLLAESESDQRHFSSDGYFLGMTNCLSKSRC